MSEHRLTTSERAVLRAVRDGAVTVDEVVTQTGAARWWVVANLDVLAQLGHVGHLPNGRIRIGSA